MREIPTRLCVTLPVYVLSAFCYKLRLWSSNKTTCRQKFYKYLSVCRTVREFDPPDYQIIRILSYKL